MAAWHEQQQGKEPRPYADQQILAASHKPPQNAPMPDMPLDLAGQLARDLLDLTARLGARADEDPFGNPVLLIALAITPAHGHATSPRPTSPR